MSGPAIASGMHEDLLLLIISSPSGAGKTTLTRDLLAHYPELAFSVSHTTRKPRPQEVEGRDYHFISREEFMQRVNDNAFAEWAEVHGNLYGTAIAEIDRCRREGKSGIVFDIDFQGARQIKARRESAISVFVLPPTIEELKERLRRRASDDDATIDRRYKNAQQEIAHYGLFDYVIVNDQLEDAKARLRAIVLAEQSRRRRMASIAEAMLRRIRSGA
jgi:guanylate kinase